MRSLFTKFRSLKESLILVILIPLIYWTLVDIIFYLYRIFEDELALNITSPLISIFLAIFLILLSITTGIASYLFFPILLIIQISKAQLPYLKKPLKIFFSIWMSFIYVLHFSPVLEGIEFAAGTTSPMSSVSKALKASQAFFTEYGELPTSTKDIGEYIDIYGCEKNNYIFCKSDSSVDLSKVKKNSWYSPNGEYQITIKNCDAIYKYLVIKATPTQGKYSHLTIEGIYFPHSGSMRVESNTYGKDMNPILLLHYFNLHKNPFKNYSDNYCSIGINN